jgi:hypothetical protein
VEIVTRVTDEVAPITGTDDYAPLSRSEVELPTGVTRFVSSGDPDIWWFEAAPQ